MFKYRIPHIVRWMFPNYTWKVKTKSKMVYFTFDDGPHPEITPWVLEQLQLYNAKATFFLIGNNIIKYPNVYKQIVDDGHSIGNHTQNHLNGWKTNTNVYLENVSLCQKHLKTNLFRPPYGKIRKNQAKGILKTHKVIMWDRLSRDYEVNLNIEETLKSMKQLPANGSIFVFHDSEKAFNNLKILLPELLNYFSQNGYEFMSLDSI